MSVPAKRGSTGLAPPPGLRRPISGVTPRGSAPRPLPPPLPSLAPPLRLSRPPPAETPFARRRLVQPAPAEAPPSVPPRSETRDTEVLVLSPEFLNQLRSIAPRRRHPKLPYVFALALITVAAAIGGNRPMRAYVADRWLGRSVMGAATPETIHARH